MDEKTPKGDPAATRTLAEQATAKHATSSEKPGFEQFYREQRPRLIVFLLYLGADRQTALDVSQETMAAAFRAWSEIRFPHTWIRTVGSRTWGRVLARLDGGTQQDDGRVATPLDHVLRREEHQRVMAALEQLPTRQRQVMAWTYDGYSPQEIAEILRISSEAVRASLYKARQAMTTVLGEKQ